MLSVVLPLLVIMSDCVADWSGNSSPKAMLRVDNSMFGTVPLPVNVSVVGLPDALCLRVSDTVLSPELWGENVMLRVRLWLAGMSIWVAETAKAPPAEILDMFSVALPELVMVMSLDWDASTRTDPKLSDSDDKDMRGAGAGGCEAPVPVRFIRVGALWPL